MVVLNKKQIKGATFFLRLILFFMSILFLEGKSRSPRHNRQRVPQQTRDRKEIEMIVFMHGTIAYYPTKASCRWSIFKIFSWRDSYWLPYIADFRMNSIYGYGPMGELGLHEFNAGSRHTPSTNEVIGAFQKISGKKQGRGSSSIFYTYGWKGYLNSSHRWEEGKRFYLALSKEVSRLSRVHGKRVRVKIFCHSHGGNVALNMGKHASSQSCPLLSAVDTLVLLGTPLHENSLENLSNGFFKFIYHIYSHSDRIQASDYWPLSSQGFFRGPQRSISLGDLKTLKLTGQSIAQCEITANSVGPNHRELWMLGGTSFWMYRKSLPSYPYPIISFASQIVKMLGYMLSSREVCHSKINISRKNNDAILYCTDLEAGSDVRIKSVFKDIWD